MPPVDAPDVKAINGDVIRLPVELDRASVTQLRARVERAGYGTSITFDGSRIRRADSAGVQMLCALVLAAEGRGVTVSWTAVSPVLLTYVSLLGVGGVMRFDGVPPDDQDLPDWVN
jgi:anti-anti-sigma regulatory factor